MNKSFSELQISSEILKALERLEYKKTSEVQSSVIPEILKNNDVIVTSQTGSGKTAAFGIPLCEKISWDENKPEVLILTPTRELAVQVKEDLLNIGRFKRIKVVSVFGKQPFSQQIRELKQKTHIIVGTPGRVLDHIERDTLDIKDIRYLVIDEADEMLNMGFIKQVEAIIKRMSKERITMLFSATMPDEIKELCKKHMNNPKTIQVKAEMIITNNIEHKILYVDNYKKIKCLEDVLIKEIPETAVIFCRTKENVDNVFNELRKREYSIGKIHGGMMQEERLETMKSFKRGDFRLLIATDVAARGIDVEGITHVINFDLPMEKEAYVHRIGRTGRAGAKGKAITFVINNEEKFLKDIEDYIGFKIESYELFSEENLRNNKINALEKLKSKPILKRQKTHIINQDITKIYLNGGKKKKIRPGDIVGAITKIEGIEGDDIGIIDVQDTISYVDILNGKGNKVLEVLKTMTIKGKKLKVEKARK